MNPLNKLFALWATIFALLATTPAKTLAQPGYRVSYQTFYDELQPYGTWVEDPTFGDVWVPNAEDDFMPYATAGHWVLTPYGSTWVSDYPWGWAAFHYGRWRYDDYYGWEWLPGRRWGPAWVNWRSGGGYYAWAPLGPNISLSIAFGNDYVVPDDYWICAPQAYICNPYISNYYIPRETVVNVIHQTTIIRNTYVNNNVTYVSGPRPTEIQRVSNVRVPIYNIGNATSYSTVVQNNTINIYRPTIITPAAGTPTVRPATVVNAVAYKQANPDAGIAFRNRTGAVAATINHNNAARLAQTANNPQPQQGNVVKIYRPMPANRPNNNPGNPNYGNWQPNRVAPNNAPATQSQQQPLVAQPSPQQQPVPQPQQRQQFRFRQPQQQAPQNQPTVTQPTPQPTIQQAAPQQQNQPAAQQPVQHQSAPQQQPQQQRQFRFRQPQVNRHHSRKASLCPSHKTSPRRNNPFSNNNLRHNSSRGFGNHNSNQHLSHKVSRHHNHSNKGRRRNKRHRNRNNKGHNRRHNNSGRSRSNKSRNQNRSLNLNRRQNNSSNVRHNKIQN